MRSPPADLLVHDQQADGHEYEGGHRDSQRDQDVGGKPEPAAVLLEPYLVGRVVVAVGGLVRLLIWRAEEVSGLVSQWSGNDRLLS